MSNDAMHQGPPEVLSREALEEASRTISFGVTDFELAESGSVVVKKVNRFSSVGKAGLWAGDEILLLDGFRCGTVEEVYSVLARVGIGGTLMMRIRRAGKVYDLPVKLQKSRQLDLQIDEVDEALERKISP